MRALLHKDFEIQSVTEYVSDSFIMVAEKDTFENYIAKSSVQKYSYCTFDSMAQLELAYVTTIVSESNLNCFILNKNYVGNNLSSCVVLGNLIQV